MKKKDPVEIVAECAEKIVERNRRFHDLIENGGSDPTWSDGQTSDL